MIRTAASNVTAWVGKATMFYAVALGVLAALVPVAAVAAGTKPAEAAFPGKNGQIAFTSFRDGNTEIYTLNQVNRTSSVESDFSPAWSPDGKKIAFASDPDGGHFEIYRMNAGGGSQTRLTFNTFTDFEPSWQPLP